ncbi:IclR family transcriptional regulator [Saccharopolyspora sp. NPDC002376]
MTAAEADTGSTSYPLRAVDRVCDILDTLANASAGVSLSEIAASANLPKSSAFRYLTALEARHYIEREPNGSSYRLGVAFRPQHTRNVERLSALARPALEKLRDQLGETTNLGILDGSQVVHTVVVESPHIMRLAARVGERGYVHCTALGKAMCAALPDDRVRMILDAAGMPRFTEATVTEPDEILADLDRTRAQGFGLDDAENQRAGRCVAVLVDDIAFPAAISVSAPADRLPRDEVPNVVKQLRSVARVLSRKMQA